MKNPESRINVSLDRQPYQVVIASLGLYKIGKELLNLGIRQNSKILIVSNPDVIKPYGKVFLDSLNSSGFKPTLLTLESGENQKNTKTIEIIHDKSFEKRLERGSIMIALGGGVIGDMTGFAASTWLRGISVIQVPTTLLAMVDASIGGKTGVNHEGGKNLIGTFHQPKLVLIDPLTLKTLPQREFQAGMAEVIKYSIIKDKSLFDLLERSNDLSNYSNINKELLNVILKRCVASKAEIVVSDEHESGIRAILNYGHTFGHVIERLCGYGTWLHGEAVSMGMIAVGKLALLRNTWNKSDFVRQKVLLTKAGLPTKWPDLDPEKVYHTLQGDKKVRDGNLRFVIPYGIGNVKICDDVSKEEIFNCLSSLND